MPIISLSISDELAADLAAFAKKTKLGKSELARAALASYIDSQYRSFIEPQATYTLSLSVICPESHKHDVHEILHALEVRSQFHLCLGKGRCIETFGLSADGKQLLSALAALEALPKIEKIQLCLSR